MPILGLGGAFNETTQLLLKQALRMGVSYWDTAASYGVSEKSIGKYFTKFPKDRKKVFLVTKSAKQYSTDKLDQELDRSLKRMNTSYVDLFLFHGVSIIEDLLLPHTCYGESDRAKSAFKRMHSKFRKILVDMDYKEAERKCPQRMQIGRLMHEAAAELA